MLKYLPDQGRRKLDIDVDARTRKSISKLRQAQICGKMGIIVFGIR